MMISALLRAGIIVTAIVALLTHEDVLELAQPARVSFGTATR